MKNSFIASATHFSSLTLKDFIRRGKVISLYRSFLRKVNNIDKNDLKKSLLIEIKSSFRKNSILVDPALVKVALIEAERYLQKLDSYVSSKGIEILQENDSDDDIKGRIGEGWPWDK